MPEFLTLLTTGSIQEYVFRSNRLSENVGGSAAVTQALEDWWTWPGCECIFVGGGNAAVRFPDEPTAHREVFNWSRKWMGRAPGLRLVAAHAPLDADVRLVYVEVAKSGLPTAEDTAPFGAPLGALPVVRDCQSTGLAANVLDKPGRAWLSDEAFAKRYTLSRSAWRQLAELERSRGLQQLRARRFSYPVELDHLGTREGASQIAIVAADGNEIGKLFQGAAENEALTGAPFEQDLRALSTAVKGLAAEALSAMIRDLLTALPRLSDTGAVQLSAGRSDRRRYLPLRPIVFGGDDLVFVCHGKLGIALATRYLRHFRELSREWLRPYLKYRRDQQDYWTTSAGVLIMPQKFPFARGYELAKELLRNAKRARREQMDRSQPDACWLDFQVVLEGSSGSLEFTRKSAYCDLTGATLHRRPYSLDAGDGQHDFARFEWLSQVFRSWPRNRSKGLLEALARGPDTAAQMVAAIRAAGIQTPDVLSDRYLNVTPENADSLRKSLRSNGIRWPDFLRSRIGLTECWDALEALDFHVPWPDNDTDKELNHAALGR